MKLEAFRNIYLIGIGGIGMSAIARFFKSLGNEVAGYDSTQTSLTNALIQEGILIAFEDKLEKIPKAYQDTENTLIVYTPAIPANHNQLNYFKNNGFQVCKRSQILGLISNNSNAIGVAGTHGKTTVSTMIAHILKQSPLDCNAFLGGISNNYQSNLLLSKKSSWMVLEADEFDRSFLQLHPLIAVVTSMDADHLDVYGNKIEMQRAFQQYVYQTRLGGKLVFRKGLSLQTKGIDAFSYGIDEKADFYAFNLRTKETNCYFDLQTPVGLLKKLTLSYPGRINIENAVAASAVALLCGVKKSLLREALKSFQGIWRRFDYQICTDKLVYIDDYAHHPRELAAIISSVREIYPKRKITGIFQPHLYTRTRDFAEEFAESLNLLNDLILLDIYPARELPIKGITSKIIMERMKVPCQLAKKRELQKTLKTRKIEILLTLGAGDIDKLVLPIKELLTTRIKC